jgi:hypothetical protein
MFQNKSLLKKYLKIDKQQTKLRTYSAQILALKLKNDDKLNSISLKDKKFLASFSGIKKGEQSYIETKLKAKKVKFNSYFKSDIFYVEMVL